MKRRVILLGPPGSGKGTVAACLEKQFGWPHVSSGYLFRQEVGKNSPLGQLAKTFIENGKLVPDEVVLQLMEHWWDGTDSAAGFILDGFPRNVPQAMKLDSWLTARGVALDVVICLKAPENEIIRRVAGRRSCPRCGRVFQIPDMPPHTEGICDDCGGELTQRADDRESVLRERFEIYRRETEPLVNYYRHQGKLVLVDAMQPVDQRCAAAADALK
ncbi:MAG: adenylate kinase [Verrucomicrobia bacterium]|nr:adenylate kinase [Verrucomicrobiota bacterium]